MSIGDHKAIPISMPTKSSEAQNAVLPKCKQNQRTQIALNLDNKSWQWKKINCQKEISQIQRSLWRGSHYPMQLTTVWSAESDLWAQLQIGLDLKLIIMAWIWAHRSRLILPFLSVKFCRKERNRLHFWAVWNQGNGLQVSWALDKRLNSTRPIQVFKLN